MKIRILIVDDTKSWLLFHKDLIQHLYGDLFEITLASSAKDALNIVRKNINTTFDIIITDLQMELDYEPKTAGEWLIEQIKSYTPYYRTPIVIVSAMYNIEHIAQRLGVDYISKNLLINNELLMKYMLENLMPFLNKLQ